MASALNGVMAIPGQAQETCAKPATARIQEWPGDIINIVPWVAESKGMFRKHCLDVKFVPLVGGPAAMVALVNSTIDFANQAPDNIIRSRSKGVEVRMTSNMYAGHWSALVAGNAVTLPHASEGYPAIMNDLAGKNIGVTALGGTTEAFMQSAFEGAKMSPTSATFISVGGVNTAVPALKGRVVDAAMMLGTGPDSPRRWARARSCSTTGSKTSGRDPFRHYGGARSPGQPMDRILTRTPSCRGLHRGE